MARSKTRKPRKSRKKHLIITIIIINTLHEIGKIYVALQKKNFKSNLHQLKKKNKQTSKQQQQQTNKQLQQQQKLFLKIMFNKH